MPGHISQSALRRLQLRMRPVLRPTRGYRAAKQGACGGDAGCNSAVREEPATIRDRWFAERADLGIPLSDAELRHGVNAGIISSTLLNDGDN